MGCWCGFKLAVIDGIWHQGWWGDGGGGGVWRGFAPPLPAFNGHTNTALNPDSALI